MIEAWLSSLEPCSDSWLAGEGKKLVPSAECRVGGVAAVSAKRNGLTSLV